MKTIEEELWKEIINAMLNIANDYEEFVRSVFSGTSEITSKVLEPMKCDVLDGCKPYRKRYQSMPSGEWIEVRNIHD